MQAIGENKQNIKLKFVNNYSFIRNVLKLS